MRLEKPVFKYLLLAGLFILPITCILITGGPYIEDYLRRSFIKANTPLLQEAINEQCDIQSYTVKSSSFDDSIYGVYHHRFENWQIDCSFDSERNWQCTCTKRE